MLKKHQEMKVNGKRLVDYSSEIYDLLERCYHILDNKTPERQKIVVDLDKFFNKFKRYKHGLSGTGKYLCEVEYTCVRLNCMKSLVEHHMNHNPIVQKNILGYIEGIRKDNHKLRDWGHDLRVKLIEQELKNSKVKK